MNPNYYNIIVRWINANDIYIALVGMLILSIIGLVLLEYLFISSTFDIFFEDEE